MVSLELNGEAEKKLVEGIFTSAIDGLSGARGRGGALGGVGAEKCTPPHTHRYLHQPCLSLPARLPVGLLG